MLDKKLIIEPSLMSDLRPHLSGGGTEAAIAGRGFQTLVWGEDRSGVGPLYQGSAETVWQIVDDRPGLSVQAYLSVFDWGGDHLGVTRLRIWYIWESGSANRGIGAFHATPAPPFDEAAELLARVRARFGETSALVELQGKIVTEVPKP